MKLRQIACVWALLLAMPASAQWVVGNAAGYVESDYTQSFTYAFSATGETPNLDLTGCTGGSTITVAADNSKVSAYSCENADQGRSDCSLITNVPSDAGSYGPIDLNIATQRGWLRLWITDEGDTGTATVTCSGTPNLWHDGSDWVPRYLQGVDADLDGIYEIFTVGANILFDHNDDLVVDMTLNSNGFIGSSEFYHRWCPKQGSVGLSMADDGGTDEFFFDYDCDGVFDAGPDVWVSPTPQALKFDEAFTPTGVMPLLAWISGAIVETTDCRFDGTSVDRILCTPPASEGEGIILQESSGAGVDIGGWQAPTDGETTGGGYVWPLDTRWRMPVSGTQHARVVAYQRTQSGTDIEANDRVLFDFAQETHTDLIDVDTTGTIGQISMAAGDYLVFMQAEGGFSGTPTAGAILGIYDTTGAAWKAVDSVGGYVEVAPPSFFNTNGKGAMGSAMTYFTLGVTSVIEMRFLSVPTQMTSLDNVYISIEKVN